MSTPLVERVQASREIEQANPDIERLICDGEGKEVPEAADFTLSRKAASETVGARTANRHR